MYVNILSDDESLLPSPGSGLIVLIYFAEICNAIGLFGDKGLPDDGCDTGKDRFLRWSDALRLCVDYLVVASDSSCSILISSGELAGFLSDEL